MPLNAIPDWFANLDDEDVIFVKKFLLASGSLKEMANQYDVTYPTVRLRLDRLIMKVKLADDPGHDSFISLIKEFTINEKLSVDTARTLISEYKKTQRGE